MSDIDLMFEYSSIYKSEYPEYGYAQNDRFLTNSHFYETWTASSNLKRKLIPTSRPNQVYLKE
jgi:hypothetical protein